MTDQRDVEAVHLAAGAVAAVMRGAHIADIQLAAPPGEAPETLEAASEQGTGAPPQLPSSASEHAAPAGVVAAWERQGPFDLWFVSYACAWSVALHRYSNGLGDVAGPEADDVQVLARAQAEWTELMRQVPGLPGGAGTDTELARMFHDFTLPWQRLLSQQWATIRDFARQLEQGGPITDAQVRERVGGAVRGASAWDEGGERSAG